MPFTLHLLAHRLAATFGLRHYVDNRPYSEDQQHGGDLKTPLVYRANLEAIARSAYSPCGLWSPIETWGILENVEKGIVAHRKIVQQVAAEHSGVHYLEMNPRVPKEQRYFCDICHLTEAGSAAFADAVATYARKIGFQCAGPEKVRR